MTMTTTEGENAHDIVEDYDLDDTRTRGIPVGPPAMLDYSLLIYRFYILRAERKWTLMLLGGLITTSIVTTLMTFIQTSAPTILPRDVYVMVLLYVSLAITTLGTTFIMMRISSVTRDNPSISNTRPYKRVQRILIDSGFIYAMCMLVTGIMLPIVTTGGLENSIPSQIATYSQALLTPLAGIAPTLIALRVVMEMPETEVDGTQRLSHLTFNRSHQSRTFGLTSLFTAMRSRLTTRTESGDFFTAHSHFTVPKEECTTTQANDDEHVDRQEQMIAHEAV
ncbi:hypothetical protein D9619_007532 [Psilocybe cf. subviscida]|uniref:Uncharacterized protein n=1 Tax=Psilocybe cf. subviscida TaxID=2480587 RepID=A0A8H5B249_9AGAR|nr:hypothetical protein D9619_007532 [Psilocybe cf. subviscida]